MHIHIHTHLHIFPHSPWACWCPSHLSFRWCRCSCSRGAPTAPVPTAHMEHGGGTSAQSSGVLVLQTAPLTLSAPWVLSPVKNFHVPPIPLFKMTLHLFQILSFKEQQAFLSHRCSSLIKSNTFSRLFLC